MLQTPYVCILFSFFLFCGPSLFFFNELAMAQNNISNSSSTIEVKVGVVLDMDMWIGKVGLSCIEMALSDLYASNDHYSTRLLLHTRDSKQDVVGAASAALDLLKNVEVEAILGPLTSMQTEFVVDLGDKAQVPIISFSATSAFISPLRSPYFVRATQIDSGQAAAISSIVKSFGWREVVPIYEASEFGEGIIPFLSDAFQSIDTRIPYRMVLSRSSTDDQIIQELYKLKTKQTRVFVVHMNPSLASRLFIEAHKLEMMEEGYVWITTDAVMNMLNSMDSLSIDSMQGVLGVKPYVPVTEKLKDFTVRWKKKYQQEHPTEINANLDVFGLWAYDAAIALAMAVEEAGAPNIPFQKPNISANSTELERIGVSQNGPKLLQAILNTSFTGLSGDFKIVEGQLQSSAYQILNVNGHGGRGVGFWTADRGIIRDLAIPATNTSSPSKTNLKPIIWPGDITTPPKGWVVPADGRKLRIAVPVKEGFRSFVEIIENHETNTTTVKGYCIDVFDAVMNAMPYYVPYAYVPFATSDGKKAGSYDDMVYSVFRGDFDGAVGDITIVANRSLYVDFPLPYTESGVSMIVKMKDDRKNTWVFLKPLSWELWLTTFWSFLFLGFVVWVLEHRINEDFRGPPAHQAGTVLWFSFSTMVFAQKEKVLSNLGRFVVLIWFFVVLVLTQSYTASLTSMLTVQRLEPAVTDINELRSKGENVGYQEGSFVYEILKQMKFDEPKLKMYRSEEELHELLKNGTKKGGIGAAFDEVPYMKLFVAKHCSEYTMVTSTNKTAGFGFTFPIGSPLVHDISRAILNVTEGPDMTGIESKWFGKTSCPESSTSITSNNLDLNSFWGLFLIAGTASFLALAIYTLVFLYDHMHVLRHPDSPGSAWGRIVALSRRFDKKDLSSHTFRKREGRGISGFEDSEGLPSFEPSPNAKSARIPSVFTLQNAPDSNCPPSPCPTNSSYDTDGDEHFVSFEATTDSNRQTAQEERVEIELTGKSQEHPRIPRV